MNTTKKPLTNCPMCGDPIAQPAGQGRRRTYCGTRCWRLATRRPVKHPAGVCRNCGRPFTRDIHRRGRARQHCTDSCRRQYDDKTKAARKTGQKAITR